MENGHVLFLFMDGVGLGEPDPANNPFARARTPVLDSFLGSGWQYIRQGLMSSGWASMAVTDACLGVPGRPQSATGQASLLTGLNVPAHVGMHYGPKPNPTIASIVNNGNLFTDIKNFGKSAIFLNPYPPRFFELLESGKRLASVNQLAALTAGLTLLTHRDLIAGRAVSPDFTGVGWRDHLGFPDTPVITLEQAGARMAQMAQSHTLAFFDYWPTDHAGHRQDFSEAVSLIENLDRVIGGMIDTWDWEKGVMIITSDHGNIEDLGIKNHTMNPVPTIVIGRDHGEIASGIHSLVDVEPAIQRFITGSNGHRTQE